MNSGFLISRVHACLEPLGYTTLKDITWERKCPGRSVSVLLQRRACSSRCPRGPGAALTPSHGTVRWRGLSKVLPHQHLPHGPVQVAHFDPVGSVSVSTLSGPIASTRAICGLQPCSRQSTLAPASVPKAGLSPQLCSQTGRAQGWEQGPPVVMRSSCCEPSRRRHG